MQKALEYWRKLGPGGQIVLLVLIAILIWYVSNRLKAVNDVAKRQMEQRAEVDLYNDQGIMPSYTNNTYKQAAEFLFQSLAGPGTDEETVYKVFRKMKNDRDVMELELAFGLRKSPWTVAPWVSPTDLKDWIQGDLSTEDIKLLNQQLSRQGITKRF